MQYYFVLHMILLHIFAFFFLFFSFKLSMSGDFIFYSIIFIRFLRISLRKM